VYSSGWGSELTVSCLESATTPTIVAGALFGHIVLSFALDEVADVLVEVLHHPFAPAHDPPSVSAGLRMRAMAPASLSHLLVSTSNCRRPLAVNR